MNILVTENQRGPPPPPPQALGENWRKCLLEDAKEAETHLWIPSGQTHGTTNFLNFGFLWSPL